MKTLKFKFDLDCKVSVYVPSTNNVSVEVDNTEQVRNVIREFVANVWWCNSNQCSRWMGC